MLCLVTRPTDVQANAARLGRLVKARRERLDLTHVQVQQAGGPSPASMQRIEQGRAGEMREATTAGIERALRWGPGSIAAVLAGGDPDEDVDLHAGTASGGSSFAMTVDLGTRLSEAEVRELR